MQSFDFLLNVERHMRVGPPLSRRSRPGPLGRLSLLKARRSPHRQFSAPRIGRGRFTRLSLAPK